MADKIAVVRLRGTAGVNERIAHTLMMLGLKRRHNMLIMDRKPELLGMVKKVQDYVAWGEASDDMIKTITKSGKKTNLGFIARLKPPKGGLRGVKHAKPHGDLGYHGDKINELIKRMM